MISKETAVDIAMAYREIETAETLLADVVKATSRTERMDIRDVFGRRVDGLELGVPTDRSGRTLFNVPWRLARVVIEAHIAAQRARLVALCEKARIELDSEAGDAAAPAEAAHAE